MSSEARSQKLIKLRSKLLVLLDAEQQLRQETEGLLEGKSNVVRVDFLKNVPLPEKLKIRHEQIEELLGSIPVWN